MSLKKKLPFGLASTTTSEESKCRVMSTVAVGAEGGGAAGVAGGALDALGAAPSNGSLAVRLLRPGLNKSTMVVIFILSQPGQQ